MYIHLSLCKGSIKLACLFCYCVQFYAAILYRMLYILKNKHKNITHVLYPGPEVWGALIEASVLDKMFLAPIAHGTTVIPVEIIQIRVILMGFCTGVGCATCIVPPWSTLQSRKLHKKSFNFQHDFMNLIILHFSMWQSTTSSPDSKVVLLDQAQFCGVWHPYTY